MILRHLLLANLVVLGTLNGTLIAQESSEQQSLLIKGILLTAKAEDVRAEGRKELSGVQAEDITIPGGFEGLKKRIEPFLGQELTKQKLIEIKQIIILYYREQNRPVVNVEVPRQQTVGGVIQYLVTEQKLGKVIYSGNNWYDSKYLDNYLHIDPNHEIAQDVLMNDLSWINRNPFHASTMKYVPSTEPGATDIEIKTQDRFPLRLYARADNAGSPAIGDYLYATGFTWGNAFWIDDLLTYEYSTSNHFVRFQSHEVNYTSFLPWKHILMLFGNYAQVKPAITDYQSKAIAAQGRLRYTIPLKPLFQPLSQDFTFGLDYKYTNNNLLFLGPPDITVQLDFPPIIQNLNVTQIEAAYNLEDSVGKHQISFNLEGYASPFHFLPHQSNEDFNSLRPHSKNHYIYGILTLGDIYTFANEFSAAALLRVQRASDTLPPTELFAIGGYNTVRGYKEAELATDNGLILNLEIRTPTISLFCNTKDQLIFLAFLDYGIGNNFNPLIIPGDPQINEIATQYLLSMGPGLRYLINPYLSIRADYGFQMHRPRARTESEEDLFAGSGKFHFGVLVSY